jgi:hypothetical protein
MQLCTQEQQDGLDRQTTIDHDHDHERHDRVRNAGDLSTTRQSGRVDLALGSDVQGPTPCSLLKLVTRRSPTV